MPQLSNVHGQYFACLNYQLTWAILKLLQLSFKPRAAFNCLNCEINPGKNNMPQLSYEHGQYLACLNYQINMGNIEIASTVF